MGGGAMCPLLCGEDGTTESGAGAVLPCAADRVLRRAGQRAWDCVACGGFAGAAEFSGGGTERHATGSFDPFAHATADRCGNTSSGVPVGAGVAGEKDLLEGKMIGID